jgi:hypothetical protein
MSVEWWLIAWLYGCGLVLMLAELRERAPEVRPHELGALLWPLLVMFAVVVGLRRRLCRWVGRSLDRKQ